MDNLKFVERITLALNLIIYQDNVYFKKEIKSLTSLTRLDLDFLICDSWFWSPRRVFSEEDLAKLRMQLNTFRSILPFQGVQSVGASVRSKHSYYPVQDQNAVNTCEQFRQCVIAPDGIQKWDKYLEPFADLDQHHIAAKPRHEAVA
ncbi:MAG: hypothetical protein MMC23_004596 [Stictis urceolatum]|nr:hypothetical protein [Stictis urceolata]